MRPHQRVRINCDYSAWHGHLGKTIRRERDGWLVQLDALPTDPLWFGAAVLEPVVLFRDY